MNKKKIIFIASLMGLALIGLVVLQVNWIRHDLKLRQEKFTRQATEAVNNAIRKGETRETVHFISREMEGVLDDSVTGYFKSLPVPEVPAVPDVPQVVVRVDSGFPDKGFTFVSEAFDPENNNEVKISTRKNGDHEEVTVSVKSNDGKSTTRTTTVHKLPEVPLNELQIAQLKQEQARELERQQLQLEKKREKIKLKVKNLSTVFEKMAVEYEQRGYTVLQRLSPETVDSLVGTELKNSGINLPYSIQLISGKNDSIIWKRAAQFEPSGGDQSISVKLFPGDIMNRDESVVITFADTFRHFISSMWMMLLSSVLFTGIIIFAFSYTVMVIFRQKKLSEIKNDFINNMTHEFKTPIATIRLASEAIGNPDVIHDVEKVRYYTGIIRDENERMNGHVENILQIAQFDKQAFAPDLEQVDIHEVIHDSILMMQLHAEQKGGKITFSGLAKDYLINADRRYIPLVILNLLDNAIKYTGQTPEIEVATRNKDGWIIISVTDNGIGMGKDKQKKIFEKFYRVTTGNLHNVKGFGLGLSYVKAIVTAHGGEITVHSELGKGSCFEVWLPVSGVKS